MNDSATSYCGNGEVSICVSTSTSECTHKIETLSLYDTWISKGGFLERNYSINIDKYDSGKYYVYTDSSCSNKVWEFKSVAKQIFKVN